VVCLMVLWDWLVSTMAWKKGDAGIIQGFVRRVYDWRARSWDLASCGRMCLRAGSGFAVDVSCCLLCIASYPL
jgi:hypothetical protein